MWRITISNLRRSHVFTVDLSYCCTSVRRKERRYEKRMPGTQIMLPVVFFASFLFGCSASKNLYKPTDKIPPQALQSDMKLLWNTLQHHHPGLYVFSSADSLAMHYNSVCNSITDSMSLGAFANKVSAFLAAIRSGHTSVRLPDAYLNYYRKNQQPRFPLIIKTWADSMVVLGSFNRADSLFKRGTVITSIDGMQPKTMLGSMFGLISTDGYSNNFKSQVISFNFPAYYERTFPLKDSFDIGYIDSAGIEQHSFVHLFKPVKDTSSKKEQRRPQPRRISHEQQKQIMLQNKRSIWFESAYHMAYMRVATFTGGKLRSFFRNEFEQLKKDSVENLVIDLRENSGGSINLSTLLARYISDHPFRVADAVTSTSRSFKRSESIHPYLPYAVAMRFSTRKENDGLYHFNKLEKKIYKPLEKRRFNGNIFIIQGGFTFSAATMFIDHVKGQQNITIVGEETGGGSVATDAVYLPEIILPSSGLKVVLPLYHVITDSTKPNTGKGIMPDVFLPPTSNDIKAGKDPKLEYIKQYIYSQKPVADSIPQH